MKSLPYNPKSYRTVCHTVWHTIEAIWYTGRVLMADNLQDNVQESLDGSQDNIQNTATKSEIFEKIAISQLLPLDKLTEYLRCVYLEVEPPVIRQFPRQHQQLELNFSL